MKRVRGILRVVAAGLVLAGAAVLSGCGDGGGHHRRHMSYGGGRGDYPVYSRGHDSGGWGGSPSGGRYGGNRNSGPMVRR